MNRLIESFLEKLKPKSMQVNTEQIKQMQSVDVLKTVSKDVSVKIPRGKRAVLNKGVLKYV